jgi:hypothetical protein
VSSNLPPGVTDSMIPGNRPEDIEEERFWMRFDEAFPEWSRFDEGDHLSMDATQFGLFMEWARSEGYSKGFADAINEAALNALYAEAEAETTS